MTKPPKIGLADRMASHIQKPDYKPEIVLNYDASRPQPGAPTTHRPDPPTPPHTAAPISHDLAAPDPRHADSANDPSPAYAPHQPAEYTSDFIDPDTSSPGSPVATQALDTPITPHSATPSPQPVSAPTSQSLATPTPPSLATPTLLHADTATTPKISPYRQDTKRVQSVVAPHVKLQIKRLLVESDIKEEELLRHALNLYFKAKGLPQIAHDGFPPKHAQP